MKLKELLKVVDSGQEVFVCVYFRHLGPKFYEGVPDKLVDNRRRMIEEKYLNEEVTCITGDAYSAKIYIDIDGEEAADEI